MKKSWISLFLLICIYNCADSATAAASSLTTWWSIGPTIKLTDHISLTYRYQSEEDDLMSIHGGLQLLAIPMQVILIAVPLAIMEGVPETIIKPNRAFELGMAGYVIALWIGFRIQPVILLHWHVGWYKRI